MSSVRPTVSQPADAIQVRKSLRSSLFFEASFLLSLAVLLVGGTAFMLFGAQMRMQAFAQLQSIVYEKHNNLETLLSRQKEQIGLVARDPTLAQLVSVRDLLGFQSVAVVDIQRAEPMRYLAEDKAAPAVVAIPPAALTQTVLLPLFDVRGWYGYMIFSPQGDGRHFLVARFATDQLLQQFLRTDGQSASTQLQLGIAQNDDLKILYIDATGKAVPLYGGSYSQALRQQSPLALALQGRAGLTEAVDTSGTPVFASYHPLPTLGWAISMQIDRSEVYQPVWLLARRVLAVGIFVVVCLSLVMFLLSRRISEPLEELAFKFNGLQSRGWKFDRTIFTDNELEIVDATAFDLTRRLREAHEYLESVVRERTHELIQQHAQEEAVFQSMEYGLLVTDRKGKVLLMNTAAQLLTGRKLQHVRGAGFETVLQLADKELRAVAKERHPVCSVLLHKKRFVPIPDPKLSIVHKSGKMIPVSLRVTPVMRGKTCTGVVAVFRDTTDERRVDTMKSEFITLVSHQLRTPLSAIRWYLEMVCGQDAGPLNAQQKSYLDEATTANQRMVRLVDALLNVSRMELGKFALSVQPVDVVAALRHAVRLFVKNHHDKAYHMRFAFHADPKRLYVAQTDNVMLQMILENVIGNAIKYSKDHGTISLSVEPKGKTHLAIRIKDEGIGIPPAQQKRVFEKLFRADNAKQSDTDGNGLGLYMSRIAAEAINGTLSFESAEGKGTTFSLIIPLAVHQKKE